jgi:NarL family two-component system sensor histidine kinase LiaS
MKRGIFSLRRLRRKLTLRYTLVTVVALLAVEFFVVVAVIAFVRSPVLPYLVAQDMRDVVAPQMKSGLAQTPPDVAGLKREVQPFLSDPILRTGEGPDQGGGSLGLPLAPDNGYVFVVDEEGRLLVSSRELGGAADGERFDAGSVPGLAPILKAALGGEGDPLRLSGYSPTGRQMLAAAPVKSDDGRVLGAVAAAFQSPNLNGPLFAAAGVGAITLTMLAAFLGTIFGFLTAWGLTRRLQRLARAAQAWSRGDFSVTAKDRSKDELGQLSRELNTMAAQLENLIQTRQELATLEARNRFARDLHDSVKQQVFATSLQVAAARALIERDTEAAEAHLRQADELVRQAQKELNVLIHEMRPAALEGKGLAGALRSYLRDWSQRAEIPAEIHIRGEREVPLEVEQALFRVAQEALANVAKHSGANNVEVDLIYGTGALTLRVADDGGGFDPAFPGEGFGLQSMHERLVRLGGRVTVESAPGRGTRIECVCPLEISSSKKGKTR